MTFPALDTALRDRRLSARTFGVYRHLAEVLDFNEFRTVKLLALGAELQIRRTHAGRAIRQLVKLGYLRQGDRAWPGGPFRYQLVWSLSRDAAPNLVTPEAS